MKKQLTQTTDIYEHGCGVPAPIIDAMSMAHMRLIKPYQRRKKRQCLRCGRMFWSEHSGRRICETEHCKHRTLGRIAEMM